MIKPEQKMYDFVMLTRKFKDDYVNGKLTRNEHDVLVWIWESTNPYNGFFSTSYKGLVQDFRNKISYDNMRKIISSLRKKQYILFPNHKGRGGPFPIYPIGFHLTNKKIQTLEYLKNKQLITIQSQPKEQPDAKPKHNFNGQNHNLKEQKDSLVKQFSVGTPSPPITTPYNDSDTKTNTTIGSKKISKESGNCSSYQKRVILVDDFFPNNYKEQRCKEIAKALGENDLRYLLSRLRKKGGFNAIQRTWGVYREIEKKDIKNRPAYFNDLLEKEMGLKDKLPNVSSRSAPPT